MFRREENFYWTTQHLTKNKPPQKNKQNPFPLVTTKRNIKFHCSSLLWFLPPFFWFDVNVARIRIFQENVQTSTISTVTEYCWTSLVACTVLCTHSTDFSAFDLEHLKRQHYYLPFALVVRSRKVIIVYIHLLPWRS